MEIRLYKECDCPAWDAYVLNHPKSNLYHLAAWKKIIKKTYGHKTYYLMATKNTQEPANNIHQRATGNQQPETRTHQQAHGNPISSSNTINPRNSIVGILPLVHLKHFLFGNSLISMPFFDLGGILANDDETEKALLFEAIELGQKLRANSTELRHNQPLTWLNQNLATEDLLDSNSSSRQRQIELSQLHQETEKIKKSSQSSSSCLKIHTATKSHKVRMLLDLPESSDVLMKSFKAKLRSQIKKTMKEGLQPKIGALESLDDFYKVFSINMRDLGSPVHSKKLIYNVLKEFPEKSKIFIVYKDKQPIACSLVVGFKDTLENPWASALKKYSRLSPNMLLYWTMLEHACNNGYAYFDFGRSSPDEGTYKFKEQWGAKPRPLHWHYISLERKPIDTEISEKSRFDKAVQYWQKLPVSVTKIIGPMIRKHIGL